MTHLVREKSLPFRRLLLLRSAVVTAILLFILTAASHGLVPEHLHWQLNLLFFLVIEGIYLWIRGDRLRWSVSLQILFSDILAISLLLYFSGGITNPLISYLIVPPLIAAFLLPATQALIIGVTAWLAYTLLTFFYHPMPLFSGHHAMHGYQSHLFGMWLSFTLTLWLVVFFLIRLKQALTEQQQELDQLRQTTSQNEHLISLATFAASTAHELSTPLATLKLLVEEIEEQAPELNALTQEANQCVDQCKGSLQALISKSQAENALSITTVEVEDFLGSIINPVKNRFPAAHIICHSEGSCQIKADQLLAQAFTNILTNAIQAQVHQDSPKVVIRSCQQGNRVQIHIQDFGLPQEKIELTNIQPGHTTKKEGLGLGLYLSIQSIQRLGGDLSVSENQPAGTIVTVTLPLATAGHLKNTPENTAAKP